MPSREPGVARESVACVRRQRCSTGSQDAVARARCGRYLGRRPEQGLQERHGSARPSASMPLLFRKPCHCSCLAAWSPNDAVSAAGGSIGSGVPRRLKVAAIARPAWSVSRSRHRPDRGGRRRCRRRVRSQRSRAPTPDAGSPCSVAPICARVFTGCCPFVPDVQHHRSRQRGRVTRGRPCAPVCSKRMWLQRVNWMNARFAAQGAWRRLRCVEKQPRARTRMR
jgi:hypothetical protein